jgi:hypothetical protein
MNFSIDPALASVIAAFLSAVGPIVSSVAALIALWRERKHQSSKPKQRPWLVFLSVFACGIAVTALLVTLIRPVPKVGDAYFEIGSADNQPATFPNAILIPFGGGIYPQPISFGKRVLSATLILIDKVMYPSDDRPRYWGYVWAEKDPNASNRVRIRGVILNGTAPIQARAIVVYEE